MSLLKKLQRQVNKRFDSIMEWFIMLPVFFILVISWCNNANVLARRVCVCVYGVEIAVASHLLSIILDFVSPIPNNEMELVDPPASIC